MRNPDVQADVSLHSFNSKSSISLSSQLPEHLRDRLIVKPAAPITISGKNLCQPIEGKFQGSREDPAEAVTMDMGDVRTDDKGRLIFVGGAGWACCVTKDTGYKPDREYPSQPDITSEFDNIDWVDDTCDGYVSVSWMHESSPTKYVLFFSWFMCSLLLFFSMKETREAQGVCDRWPAELCVGDQRAYDALGRHRRRLQQSVQVVRRGCQSPVRQGYLACAQWDVRALVDEQECVPGSR